MFFLTSWFILYFWLSSFYLLLLLTWTGFCSLCLDYFLHNDHYGLCAGIYWNKVCQWTICLSLFWYSSTLKCQLCIRWGTNFCSSNKIWIVLPYGPWVLKIYISMLIYICSPPPPPLYINFWQWQISIFWRYRIGYFHMVLLVLWSFVWRWYSLERPPFR